MMEVSGHSHSGVRYAREIEAGADHIVDAVGEDADRDMGDRFQYLGIVQTSGAGLIQNIPVNSTMSGIYVQRERQDRRCLAVAGLTTLCIGQVGGRQARRTSSPGVGSQPSNFSQTSRV